MERASGRRRGRGPGVTRLVALTGATGFIGSNLIRSLMAGEVRVRALTRRPVPDDGLHPTIDWVSGSLEDPATLERLVQGADAVVHCAGAVRGASRRFFEETNAQGTARLVEAAARQPTPPRFLFVSSLAAREPHLSWYAASKRHGEELLHERADGMAWAVFRPTAVYGRGDREMMPLFESMRRGLLPVVGRSEARLTLLHVDDLVKAIARWLEHPEAVQGVFELNDGTPDGYDWRLIAQIAEQVWQRPVRRVPVPAALLFVLAGLNLGLANLMGYAPMLTPGKVRELRHPNWACDNTPLTTTLGWEPGVDLATALRTL